MQQLTPFLDKATSPHLSGFRKIHSCQDVVLHFVEKYKEAIDLRILYNKYNQDLDLESFSVMINTWTGFTFGWSYCTLCVLNIM